MPLWGKKPFVTHSFSTNKNINRQKRMLQGFHLLGKKWRVCFQWWSFPIHQRQVCGGIFKEWLQKEETAEIGMLSPYVREKPSMHARGTPNAKIELCLLCLQLHSHICYHRNVVWWCRCFHIMNHKQLPTLKNSRSSEMMIYWSWTCKTMDDN